MIKIIKDVKTGYKLENISNFWLYTFESKDNNQIGYLDRGEILRLPHVEDINISNKELKLTVKNQEYCYDITTFPNSRVIFGVFAPLFCSFIVWCFLPKVSSKYVR